MRILSLSAVVLIAASQCFAGSIGIYADPSGTGCNLNIPQGESAIVYVVGRTSSTDPTGGYIDSGEFRIVGLPTTWTASSTRAPEIAVAIGDPLGNGVILAWATEQHGVIPLFTIVLTATTQEYNMELRVVKHVNPNPPWVYPTKCPWFHYSCGAPCDTSGVCADGISLAVNGDCRVGTKGATWSDVRLMYR